MADKDTSKDQASISLVRPSVLALRLAYLVSIDQGKGIFLRTTRKRLEKLAENKNSIAQGNTEKESKLDKAPITEAYIDCARHELEKLGFTLIKADKEYLACVAEDLHKVSLLKKDNVESYSLDEKALEANIKVFWEGRKNKTSKGSKKDKPIAENNEVALKAIWSTLVAHVQACLADNAKIYINKPESLALTYEQLTDKLKYKIYRNGLASFLYSIEEYCKTSALPKLNYLVVKEGNGLPDGLKNKHYGNFIGEIKKIINFIETDKFFEPLVIEYKKKNRSKKSRQPVADEAYSELDA